MGHGSDRFGRLAVVATALLSGFATEAGDVVASLNPTGGAGGCWLGSDSIFGLYYHARPRANSDKPRSGASAHEQAKPR
jgi:hypothetical protein